jgi:hypothetical protein
MRRILSILLMLVLVSGPAGPASALASGLASGWTGKVDESRLPACCRRNGKHHCAIMSSPDAADGPTSISANNSCPFMPRTLASTAPSVVALLNAAASHLEFPTQFLARHGSVTAAPINDRHNWPQRGPPAAQLL